MRHISAAIIAAVLAVLPAGAAEPLTLDSCLAKAEAHYPLIRRYGIIERTQAIELSDINRSWLPRADVYAQASVQNAVPTFPAALADIASQLGAGIRGLDKFQYKAGADISQTVWDGGASHHNRRIARADAETGRASLAVELYALRERVQSLYFGILLLDKQIAINDATAALLRASHERLSAMVAGGTAMPADADMVEAQQLTVAQQTARARAARAGYADMLGIFIGEDAGSRTLALPDATVPAEDSPAHPELELFGARRRLNDERIAATSVATMPRFGAFVQGWYGYPGLDYFKSMTGRDPSFNILAGVRLSWNIDAFYTRDNRRRRLAEANEGIDAERATFLHNAAMQAAAGRRDIEGIRAAMADDGRIVTLRASVRRAAESQLANGIIDTTALLDKITAENRARLDAGYHEIELIQSICHLKYILNR